MPNQWTHDTPASIRGVNVFEDDVFEDDVFEARRWTHPTIISGRDAAGAFTHSAVVSGRDAAGSFTHSVPVSARD